MSFTVLFYPSTWKGRRGIGIVPIITNFSWSLIEIELISCLKIKYIGSIKTVFCEEKKIDQFNLANFIEEQRKKKNFVTSLLVL